MTTVIRLDKQAMNALIASDPEFKLELQRAVIAETVRTLHTDYVEGDVAEIVNAAFIGHKAALVEAFKTDSETRRGIIAKFDDWIEKVRSNTPWGSGKPDLKLKPELQLLIDQHVKAAIDHSVRVQVGTVDERVKQATDKLLERVLERIGHVGGIVEHNWKVEALKQIREDVTKTITGMLAS